MYTKLFIKTTRLSRVELILLDQTFYTCFLMKKNS